MKTVKKPIALLEKNDGQNFVFLALSWYGKFGYRTICIYLLNYRVEFGWQTKLVHQ